jgi:hypothetical protein
MNTMMFLETYAGQQYYRFKYSSGELKGWGIVGVHNGFMYEVVIMATDVSLDELRATLGAFVSTFQFP